MEEALRLAPYVTTTRELILLSGVFAFDEVTGEATARQKAASQRFSIECRVTLVERQQGLPIRFDRRSAFFASEPSWVAHADSCRVLP